GHRHSERRSQTRGRLAGHCPLVLAFQGRRAGHTRVILACSAGCQHHYCSRAEKLTEGSHVHAIFLEGGIGPGMRGEVPSEPAPRLMASRSTFQYASVTIGRKDAMNLQIDGSDRRSRLSVHVSSVPRTHSTLPGNRLVEYSSSWAVRALM